MAYLTSFDTKKHDSIAKYSIHKNANTNHFNTHTNYKTTKTSISYVLNIYTLINRHIDYIDMINNRPIKNDYLAVIDEMRSDSYVITQCRFSCTIFSVMLYYGNSCA